MLRRSVWLRVHRAVLDTGSGFHRPSRQWTTGLRAAAIGCSTLVLLLSIARAATAAVAHHSSSPSAMTPLAYRSVVTMQLARAAEVVTEEAPLKDDPSLPDAVPILADASEQLQGMTAQAHALTPPPCLVAVHRYYLAAVELISSGTAEARNGAEQGSRAQVDQGDAEVQRADAALAAVAERMQAARC
jgi:hypothetical protein